MTEKSILNVDYTQYETTLSPAFLNRKNYQAPDPTMVKAMIPSVVVDIFVKPGDKVKKDDKLLTMEAMKMKNDTFSPLDGKVESITVKKGDRVAKGQLLIRLKHA